MSQKKQEVYIVAAQRTPVGKFQGALKSLAAPKLGAVAIKAALGKTPLSPDAIDEIIFGQVLTAGVGQAPARQAALYGGLPISVNAMTIGQVCGSGLKSVTLGAQSIMCNNAHLVVAGGQESMSNAPYFVPTARSGMRLGHKEILDSMITDGLWDPYNNLHMGSCAEVCAQEYKVTREEQDQFALESYKRAQHATANGFFKDEIAAVQVVNNKETSEFSVDEEPQGQDLSKMSGLRPAFEKTGTITAANASKINDGAAAIILASEEAMQKHDLKPLAKIVSWACHAHEPKMFTTAPVYSTKKALEKAKLSVSDIDLFEINEAFAVVPLVMMKELNIAHSKVNIHGGACALGHPLGASGARILTTLLYALKKENKSRGLATLCIGGGEGISMVVERV